MQKVIQLTISLSFKDSLMVCPEEVLVHEEQQGFKARISNFFSQKLGYLADAELDQSKMIYDVHHAGPFVIAVTGKNVIIVERPAMAQLFESEFLERARATLQLLEQAQGIRLMSREL